jgi:hypothetical protein
MVGRNNPSIAHEDVRGDDSLNPTNGQTHTQGSILTDPIVSHTGVSPTQSYGSDTNLVGMDGKPGQRTCKIHHNLGYRAHETVGAVAVALLLL